MLAEKIILFGNEVFAKCKADANLVVALGRHGGCDLASGDAAVAKFPKIVGTWAAPSGMAITGGRLSETGRVSHVYDTTDHELCVYDGGWKGEVVSQRDG